MKCSEMLSELGVAFGHMAAPCGRRGAFGSYPDFPNLLRKIYMPTCLRAYMPELNMSALNRSDPVRFCKFVTKGSTKRISKGLDTKLSTLVLNYFMFNF